MTREAALRQCQRCHRPLEGDEEYVCCAGAALMWRCQDCGKVSEGFAFPYGMCPACGGKLELGEARSVDGAASLAAIRTAFEIELGGMAFYRRAAHAATDPVMRDLFGRLAVMEDEHMATLARRYHTEVPVLQSDSSIERASVWGGAAYKENDPVSLFQVAIAFEERAAQFFRAREGLAAAGSAERKLYQELAAEEGEHVALLRDELTRYHQNRPSLLGKRSEGPGPDVS